MRWLALLITLGLVSTADAQVFKPKGKKADVIEKKPAKTSAKKAPKTAKKKGATKAKKTPVADRDEAPEAASKSDDNDFVKITDDEEIE